MPTKMKESRIVVTLDGLAGSGKSSLAEGLARELGWVNFSSGLLYRTIGFLALQENINTDDEAKLVQMLKSHKIELVSDHGTLRDGKPKADSIAINLDGAPLDANLHTPEISEATSRSSKFPEVRRLLIDLQRTACPGRNLIAEGRDMGTVIFPDAPVKFFIEATVDVRVKRRLAQLGSQFEGNSTQEISTRIAKEITERDKRDAERTVAPTVAAPGAVIIDNSQAPLSETIKIMAETVKRACGLLS